MGVDITYLEGVDGAQNPMDILTPAGMVLLASMNFDFNISQSMILLSSWVQFGHALMQGSPYT